MRGILGSKLASIVVVHIEQFDGSTRFHLQYADKIDGSHTGFVFCKLFGTQRSFSGFFREVIQFLLHIRRGSQAGDTPGNVRRQTSADGIKEFIDYCKTGRLYHGRILTRHDRDGNDLSGNQISAAENSVHWLGNSQKDVGIDQNFYSPQPA